MGTLIVDVFRWCFDHLPYFLVWKSMISQWDYYVPAITCNEGIQCHSTRIIIVLFRWQFQLNSSMGFSLMSVMNQCTHDPESFWAIIKSLWATMKPIWTGALMSPSHYYRRCRVIFIFTHPLSSGQTQTRLENEGSDRLEIYTIFYRPRAPMGSHVTTFVQTPLEIMFMLATQRQRN